MAACQPRSVVDMPVIARHLPSQSFQIQAAPPPPSSEMDPKKRPAAAADGGKDNPKKRPAAAGGNDDNPKKRPAAAPPKVTGVVCPRVIGVPGRAFANWRTSPEMTMDRLVFELRQQLDGTPRTKIRVVTAHLGSTCPMSTLVALMPEVHHTASAVYDTNCVGPRLLSFQHSNEHIYLSLPSASTAPLCFRHERLLCPHMPASLPHVLMCDRGALDAKLPNIVDRLFGICLAFALISWTGP